VKTGSDAPARGGTTKGRKTTLLLALILTSVFLAAVAQLTLKHGMNVVTADGANPISLRDPAGTFTRIASDVWVWLGLITFAVSAAVWLLVLGRTQLSYAYPFASLTYVFILLFDRFALDQTVAPLRWAGVACIIAGIVLVSRT
jgi:multidrug transporter EmrE-like cation transporter